jgi:hypothetical protein
MEDDPGVPRCSLKRRLREEARARATAEKRTEDTIEQMKVCREHWSADELVLAVN